MWSEHGKEPEIDQKESDVFELLFLVDDATSSTILLLNIFVPWKHLPVAVLELVDCQGHLEDGGGNDGTFIYTIFIEHIRKFYPHILWHS